MNRRLMVVISPLQVSLPSCWLSVLLLTATTILFLPFFSYSLPRSEDHGVSKYLYYDFTATTASHSSEFFPIKEYVIHTAPGEDFERNEIESKSFDNHDHVIPYFLRSDDEKNENGPRVVQFYSPFIGECVYFRPKYVKLARDFNARKDTIGTAVEFHALSCSEFRKVCHDQNVVSYPTIKVFKASSIQGIPIFPNGDNEITVEGIAIALGITLKEKLLLASQENDAIVDSKFHLSPQHRHHHDALGVMQKSKQHTQKHSFVDAALSCTYAFENAIYPSATASSSDNKPLAADRKAAFQEWIDLLYWSLPPIWKIHILINDIRTHFDAATSSKKNLVQMVRTHHDVIHEHEENRQWTLSCRRSHMQRQDQKSDVSGSTGLNDLNKKNSLPFSETRTSNEEAYLCGFWNLLHM